MMKRLMAVVLSLALACAFVPTAGAASNTATEAAQALHELGLFQGVGTNADGSPDFALDRVPTRAEAVTMLVRLLGKDGEAKAGTWTTPFTDVADWAKPYVGYAYVNGLTTGTSETTFGGDTTINATQYLTFVLRALGYTSGTDFQWDKAWEKSDAIGLTDGRYNASDGSFTRGDVALISNNALSTPVNGTAQKLSETFQGDNISTKLSKALQGVWTSHFYPDTEKYKYNAELGLYESLTLGSLSANYWIFEGNTYTRIDVSRYPAESFHNNRHLTYSTGTYTIDGTTLKLAYDVYVGEDYNPDLTDSGITPIQEVRKTNNSDLLDITWSDTEFSYCLQSGLRTTFVKCEGTPTIYNTYKPVVAAFESQLQKNAVNFLPAPVITSVYQATDAFSKRGLKVTWDTVPHAEGYELWYREGEFGKWYMWSVEKGNPWITYTSKEVSHVWNYRSQNVMFYFKVRAYAHNANGEKIYSEDSNMVYAMQP